MFDQIDETVVDIHELARLKKLFGHAITDEEEREIRHKDAVEEYRTMQRDFIQKVNSEQFARAW